MRNSWKPNRLFEKQAGIQNTSKLFQPLSNDVSQIQNIPRVDLILKGTAKSLMEGMS